MRVCRIAVRVAAVVAAIAIAPVVGAADADDDGATRLDDIVVVGKPQFLYESDRQLARVTAGLPDFAPGVEADRGLAGALADALTQDPNDLEPDQQQMMLRMTEGGDPHLP